MGVKIIDNMPKFKAASDEATNRALNKMAADIERIAKQTAPHDKGPLVASGLHKQSSNGHWVVVFNKEYAGYQERGMRKDGTRVVKNYSKPGKKAHFLGDAGAQIAKQANTYFKEAGSNIRI